MIRVLQVQVERDTLALNLQVDEVQSIVEVELDRLLVVANLARSEDDWDLNLVLLTWHKHTTWDNWKVKISLFLKVRLKRDGLSVEVGNLEHLLDRSGLGRDEARAEVEDMVVKLDAGLASLASELELILGPTHNSKHHLEVLQLVLGDGRIVDLNDNFVSFLNSAGLGCDLDVLVNLSLPDKVKVELTVVRKDNLL